MTDFIIKYRWPIIIISLMVGTGLGLLIHSAETDPEIRNYVPASMASRKTTDTIEQSFGAQDMIIAVFTDSTILTPGNLEEIKEVDRAFSRFTGIGKINSLYTAREIKGEEGMMTVSPLIESIPETPAETEALRRRILDNRFANGIVVSSDMTAAAITGTISKEVPEHITLAKVDSTLESHRGSAEIYKGGLPYIRRYILSDVKHDAMVLIPLALVIMLLVLKFTLGEWKSILLPFSVVVLSAAACMGLVPLFGWKISILTLLVPIIMISVANNYGIYFIAGYQELSRSGMVSDRRGMVRSLTGMLTMPVLFSGLTTVAGILGLLAHSIIPARQVGILAAIGVSLALLMSLTFIPAVIYMRKPAAGKSNPGRRSFDLPGKITEMISAMVIKNPRRVLIAASLFTVLVATGMFLLRIDTNQEHYFPGKHPVSRASQIINSRFGGSQTISVMISGDIKDPQIMKGIDDLTEHIGSLEGVGHVFSVSDAVRAMTRALYLPGEEEYDRIPESRDAIAQMFELYYMSGDPDDFSQLMNFENDRAHVLVQLSRPDNEIIRAIRDDLKEYTAHFPARITVGGYAIIMADFAGKIIKGQITSLAFALVTVLLLLSLIFRSVFGGLTGIIPLAASILVQFGVMGFTGIALDAATALLSSIMIGVGVDFTIQFLWRYNHELNHGKNHNEAMRRTYMTTGRTVIINALGVMSGFTATFFSGFLSIRFFGYLILLSLGSCLLYSIIVLPAFMILFRPKFIEAAMNNIFKKEYYNEKDFSIDTIPADGVDGIGAVAGSCAVDAEMP